MSRVNRGAATKHVAQRKSPEEVARLPQDTGAHRIASSRGQMLPAQSVFLTQCRFSSYLRLLMHVPLEQRDVER